MDQVAGYGLGPMIWSPMSEIPIVGRNPVYLATLVVFVAFQVPTALANNFGMLLAFRFLTGFFGSPVLATGGASLSDIWRPSKRAYAMSIWGVSAICGPTMGPLVGGFAVQYGSLGGGFTAAWTWPIWELMWLSAFCLVFLFFFLPETSANNILVRRTMRLRKITGDDKLTCEPMLMGDEMTGKDIVMMSLVRPFTLNFTEPMVCCPSDKCEEATDQLTGVSTQLIHRLDLWHPLYLVRIIRESFHWHLSLWPWRGGSRLPRHTYRSICCDSTILPLLEIRLRAEI